MQNTCCAEYLEEFIAHKLRQLGSHATLVAALHEGAVEAYGNCLYELGKIKLLHSRQGSSCSCETTGEATGA